MFSYCKGPYSTLNNTCLWTGSPFNHDQTFKWSLSHYSGGNIVWTHKLRFMFSIPWSFCNTLFPTQIGVAIKGGFEIVIHGITCTLNLHPNWVVVQLDVTNAFNSMSKGVIFQTSCSRWGHDGDLSRCQYSFLPILRFYIL